MAAFIVLRAIFGYLFLILIVRVVGRRPGKQLTPFEFVLIFYLGGLTLTGIVGNDFSLENAITQILTIALCHYLLSELRFRSGWFARLLDGTPLILLEKQTWRTEVLKHMRIQDDDVMDVAREQGVKDLSEIRAAILETVGDVTIVASAPDSKENS